MGGAAECYNRITVNGGRYGPGAAHALGCSDRVDSFAFSPDGKMLFNDEES